MFKKRKGFMLAEAAVTIVVAILTLGILNQAIGIVKTVSRSTHSEILRWHISNEKLQDKILHSTVTNISDTRMQFITDDGKTYILEEHTRDKMLRLTTPTGGHMPILTKLTYVHFKRNGNLIIIITKDKSNRKSEMYLINDPK